MANRIVQTVIVVDSGMGNEKVVDATSGGNLRYWNVNAIAIAVIDTAASLMKITGTNTATDVIAYLTPFSPVIHFPTPQRLDTIKVPTLTSTTGMIYLA